MSKVLILSGGAGYNLHPLTDTRPKSMIYICGKPILEYVLNWFIEVGFVDIEIVVGHKKEKIINYFERGDKFGVSINYVEQKQNGNIGSAILSAKERFKIEEHGEYFVLSYGDIFTPENILINAISSFHSLHSPVASVCLTTSTQQYGNVCIDQEGKITQYIEKPERDLGNYVFAGIFVLPVTFLNLLEKVDGNMEKAFEELIKESKIYASIWDKNWIDIDYPWDVLQANRSLMDTWTHTEIGKSVKMKGNVTIDGIVKIKEGVTIESGVVIKGPCYIGEGSYIGNNALVRDYTSIGSNCIIGYGVEIKNSVLLDNTTVGRLSFIGDSVIGEDVGIEPGVMTVNRDIEKRTIKVNVGNKLVDSGLKKLGSFIGDNTMIGAGNTLLPGTIIASGKRIEPHGNKL